MFTERDELIVGGIAAQAAIGIDNARLYRASRQAQESLRLLNETLEQRVADEIAERMRTEEALRQAQKMEAVGQLTGGVAHDFNNLLTAICGGADTLQRLLPQELGANERRIWRALRMIDQGAQRAATLTQRLLAFARRQALDPRPIDANKLVAGMSELLRRTLGEAVAIETVLAGGLWRDHGRPEPSGERAAQPCGECARCHAEWRQADHRDREQLPGRELCARSTRRCVPGQYVMIAVSDTGTGMTSDTIERVFEPFFTTKEVGQGTGLGLSQVYGFIKQSNGHIKMYSEVGQGTVVKLYLPRLVGDTRQVDERAESDGCRTARWLGRTDPGGGRRRGRARLQHRDAARTGLSRADGAERPGRAGGAGAASLRIRLLFTDVGLPGGMNGRQLADQARRQRPELLVLFTTGYARNAIVHGGILDPGTHLLPKPFTHGALAAKIRALLDG